jgi:DNA repair protein RadC
VSVQHPTIREWPAEDRPRERFLIKGAEALSDAECLAILLGAGAPGQTAVDQAQALLAAFGSLGEIAGREVQELAWVGGLGIAKAVRLGAAVELARRLRSRPNGGRIRLSSPEEVAGYYGPGMEDKKKEVFRVESLELPNFIREDPVLP